VRERPATIERLRAAGCVFAEEEAALLHEAAGSDAELDAMLARRVKGDPIEQIVGWAEFCGLRIVVEPGVFVPRRRSEFLVETAVSVPPRDAVVVDVCCGTGALAAAVMARVATSEVYAIEVDPAAVHCASRNLPNAHVYEGDLYAPLPSRLRNRVDLVLANAPYVPSDAVAFMPREAREFEHRVALDGGADGLDVQRRVIAEAPRWLAPGGHLLVETSDQQAPVTLALMQSVGLAARIVTDDDREATVAIATSRP
jgi:release factor glutamine methyltransferase